MTVRVALLDYGVGNLRSLAHAVQNAVDETVTVAIVTTAAAINAADRIILPGVGAFGACMEKLDSHGLLTTLQNTHGKKPLLGICVGMQMLMSCGHEHGVHSGLGYIDGDVIGFDSLDAFPTTLKVPNIGWRAVSHNNHPLFAGIADGAHWYFVHSFVARPTNTKRIIARSHYGIEFAAAVADGLTMGIQCHPEKSDRVGLQLLRNFCTASFE